MESRVPVPTDNIFKFYALFGLLLFIFCCGSLLYVTRASNELIFSTLPELEGLKQIPQRSHVEQTRLALLERKLEIKKADKSALLGALGILLCIALATMVYGFWKWEKELQPILDRTIKAQMEIAELQLQKLRRELNTEEHKGEGPGGGIVEAPPLDSALQTESKAPQKPIQAGTAPREAPPDRGDRATLS